MAVIDLQCLASMLPIEGSLGSNVIAKAGPLDLFALLTFFNAFSLGISLALSMAEVIVFTSHSLNFIFFQHADDGN